MNNLCKQYIKNAKVLFPVVGKAEKEYFKNLELNVKDYCVETSVSSLEELYKDFGTPSEVANSYFSNANIDYILKQIKRTKIIKITLIALIIATLIALSAYCTVLYCSYQVFKTEQIFSEETFIK
jgi:uncharacterized membrane protein